MNTNKLFKYVIVLFFIICLVFMLPSSFVYGDTMDLKKLIRILMVKNLDRYTFQKKI